LLVKPELTEVQFVPLLVEKKTPTPVAPPIPEVPAKRFVPLTAKDSTLWSVKPELTAVQLVPLLVER
jgi:hypothetical protein